MFSRDGGFEVNREKVEIVIYNLVMTLFDSTMNTTSNSPETITDFAGNTFPASALNDQETPNWDPHGARRDQAMRGLADVVAEEGKKVPKVGDNVKVTGGRKHKGKEGRVFWRGPNQFKRPSRYGDSMARALLASLGHNDVLGIQMEDGTKFFVPLPQTEKI